MISIITTPEDIEFVSNFLDFLTTSSEIEVSVTTYLSTFATSFLEPPTDDFSVNSFITFLEPPFPDFLGTFFSEASFSTTLVFDFDFFFQTYESMDVPYVALKLTFFGKTSKEIESMQDLY